MLRHKSELQFMAVPSSSQLLWDKWLTGMRRNVAIRATHKCLSLWIGVVWMKWGRASIPTCCPSLFHTTEYYTRDSIFTISTRNQH